MFTFSPDQFLILKDSFEAENEAYDFPKVSLSFVIRLISLSKTKTCVKT